MRLREMTIVLAVVFALSMAWFADELWPVSAEVIHLVPQRK